MSDERMVDLALGSGAVLASDLSFTAKREYEGNNRFPKAFRGMCFP